MKKGVVKVEFTKEQYALLMKLFNMSLFVYEIGGDMLDSDVGEKMKRIGKRARVMEDYLLRYAEAVDFKKVAKFGGGLSFSESFNDETFEHLRAFEEYVAVDQVASELGERDFIAVHTGKELEDMNEKHHGYLGVPMHPYLEKYYDEFAENGFQRLRIVEDGDVRKAGIKK